jgi:alpha-L-rhamnosidase
MAEKGATTIWELWNGDSGDPGMNSGNHVMLVGDLVIWLYEYLAGISPAEPGFKQIRMRPVPTGDLNFVEATHKSPYGLISSRWKRDKDQFAWDVVLPANTRTTIYIPSNKETAVLESGKNATNLKDLKFIKWEKGYSIFEAGSGEYSFKSELPSNSRY